MTVLHSGSASDVGRVRSVNEDLALEGLTLFAVADGMGGHAGGEVAARIAIETLQGIFETRPSAEGLLEAVSEANARVFERSLSDPEVRGMGTTLVSAALVEGAEGDRLVVANVGDSRAYRYRGGSLTQLSGDHSVAEELLARGELSTLEAASHPQRHILTRALGVAPDVEVDAWSLVPLQGDRYLLCSDGLSNEVSADRIEGVLRSTSDPLATARALVRMANEHGGNDNVTVVVMNVVVGDSTAGDALVALTPSAAALDELRSRRNDGGSQSDSKPAGSGTPAPADPGGVWSGVEVKGAELTGAVLGGSGAPSGSARLDGGRAAAGSSGRGGTAVLVRAPAGPTATRGAARPGRNLLPRTRGPRLLTFRMLLFTVLLAAVLFGAFWSTSWYVQHSWFVRTNGQNLVIFQGRPAGFLWYHPVAKMNTGVSVSQVPDTYWTVLRTGVEQPSEHAALEYVSRLEQQLVGQQAATPPPTIPPTTTPPPAAAAHQALRDSAGVATAPGPSAVAVGG